LRHRVEKTVQQQSNTPTKKSVPRIDNSRFTNRTTSRIDNHCLIHRHPNSKLHLYSNNSYNTMKKFLTLTAIACTATLSAVAPAMADKPMGKPEATPTTAASVSMKFNTDCNCTGTGGSSYGLGAGGSSAASPNGLKELSSAVATGSGRADAKASTYDGGTNATAAAYSTQVVSLSTHTAYSTKGDDEGSLKTVSDTNYVGSVEGLSAIPAGISATGFGITGSATIPANVIKAVIPSQQ
jgi:hypothetical protein